MAHVMHSCNGFLPAITTFGQVHTRTYPANFMWQGFVIGLPTQLWNSGSSSNRVQGPRAGTFGVGGNPLSDFIFWNNYFAANIILWTLDHILGCRSSAIRT